MKNEGKELTDWKIFEELKDKYKDAVLLFRDHDRYESYKEDADRVANVLGISVSERDGGFMRFLFLIRIWTATCPNWYGRE